MTKEERQEAMQPNPAPEKTFLPETTMDQDNHERSKWIKGQLEASGVQGEEKEESFNRLAFIWRHRHPRDTVGNYLQNTSAETINRTFYGAKKNNQKGVGPNREPGSRDSLGDAAKSILARGDASSLDQPAPSERDAQRIALAKWARESGASVKKLPPQFDIRSEKNRGGEEHHAWPGPAGRWVKITANGSGNAMGYKPVISEKGGFIFEPATPAEYLQQKQDWNAHFGDDIRLHGALVDRDGNVQLITSQPDIKGERVSEADIRKAFEDDGFVYIGNANYYRASDNVALFDIHDRNAYRVGTEIVPFDGMLIHPDAAMREAIKDARAEVVMRRPAPKAPGNFMEKARAAFNPDSDTQRRAPARQ